MELHVLLVNFVLCYRKCEGSQLVDVLSLSVDVIYQVMYLREGHGIRVTSDLTQHQGELYYIILISDRRSKAFVSLVLIKGHSYVVYTLTYTSSMKHIAFLCIVLA